MAQTFELADLLLAAMDARMASVFTAAPGRVVRYDAGRQSVDVQPTVRQAYTSETGDRVHEALPLLQGVPVMFLGGGGYRTTYPVAAGDTCLVVFMSCSIDHWLAQGGNDVDPGDDRRHALSDAVALVGLRDFKHALANAPTDRMSIGRDSGASIEILQNEVRVGGNVGAQPPFHGPALITALSTVLGAIGAAVGGIPGGAGAGASIATAVTTFVAQANAALATITKVV